MAPDHFDVFGTDHDDEHGSTGDYWEGYADVVAEAFAVTHDNDEVPFLLSDEELDALSDDIDTVPVDVDLPAWFAPDTEVPF